MKKHIYITFIFMILMSCTQEVVLDDILDSTPRLVIEANIDWNKNDDESSKIQTIKLTRSISYYSQEYPVVTNATITVTNRNNTSMGNFIYDASQLQYVSTNFNKPTIGETYFLKIELEGQIYTASDIYTSIENPNHITQSVNYDFDPEKGFIQLDYNIDNEIDVENYYLFKIEPPKSVAVLPEYSNADDSLLNEELGENNYDFTYINDELAPGDLLKITTYGISKPYNDFLTLITTNIDGDSSGLFSTTPSTIRGNVLNETDEENRAFGYFSINQFSYIEYIIEERSNEEIVTEL